jgi:hypothetical protein
MRRSRTMKPNTVAVAHRRPNRVLIALAAAWMILSLAIGGAVTAENRAETPPSTAVTSTVVQP